MHLFSRRALALVASVFLFVGTQMVPAQAGWQLDPYAGLSAGFLQPAATVASPYGWELNLTSGSFNAGNNYAFLGQASGLRLLQDLRAVNTAAADDQSFRFQLGNTVYNYDFPRHERKIFAHVGVDVTGPALSLRLGQRTRIGAFTRLRSHVGTSDVDGLFHYYIFREKPTDTDLPVSGDLAVVGAVWAEAGLQLARAVPLAGGNAELRLGASPRLLFPTEGIVANNPEGLSVRRYDSDSIKFINANTTIGLSDGLRGEDLGTLSGSGFAVDLGLQLAWGSTETDAYRYVLGISLLDLGSLNYDQGAQSYRFTNPGTITLDTANYEFSGLESTDEVLAQLSRDANGTDDATEGQSFSVGLPTMLSAQFTMRPVAGVRLSAAWRGNLLLNDRQLTSGNQLTFAAHYGRWWYGGGLTAGVYDWQEFNVGFQLRLGPLYFGTERLIGTVLPAQQLYGGGFYAGLRIHAFKPGGGRRGQSRSRGKGSKNLGCYQF